MIERFLDIFFRSSNFSFFPFMIVVAVILKLTGEGGILFRNNGKKMAKALNL